MSHDGLSLRQQLIEYGRGYGGVQEALATRDYGTDSPGRRPRAAVHHVVRVASALLRAYPAEVAELCVPPESLTRTAELIAEESLQPPTTLAAVPEQVATAA